MKKIIAVLLAVILCVGTIAFAEETTKAINPIKLIADNKLIDTPTHIINNRTLVPLRALLESTNASVDWDNSTRTATVTRGNTVVKVQIDNPLMQTPSGDVTLDASPVLLNEGTTTYVPLRAICEAFGFTVDWDPSGSNTILVVSPDGCPYFDLYDGATLEQQLIKLNATPEEFTAATGINYEENKDKLYTLIDNIITIEKIAEMNGYNLNDMLAVVGVEGISPETSWGEFLGNLTMKQYIENFTPALQYGMTAEMALESIIDTYGLTGCSLNTQFKYLRVIMEKMDYEYQKMLQDQQEAMQKAEEEKMAAAQEHFPSLLENKIHFTITLTDNRKMKGELYPDLAPATVANFTKLCEEDFYSGLIFHRVIDGFMIQGGGFDKDFNAKEAASIPGEFTSNGFINLLKHEKGVLSMARTNDPNSASSQFFIMDEAASHLDGQYAAFGKITEGLSVIESISQVKTETNDKGHSDVPVKPIIIKSITIDK